MQSAREFSKAHFHKKGGKGAGCHPYDSGREERAGEFGH